MLSLKKSAVRKNNISDADNVESVLSAIKNMVEKESEARFTDALDEEVPFISVPVTKPKSSKPKAKIKVKPKAKTKPKTSAKAKVHNLPSKIFILYPHMRVDKPKSEPEILNEQSETPFDTVDAVMSEDKLRNMVREVVKEQLRGELGLAIINAVKQDLLVLPKAS